MGLELFNIVIGSLLVAGALTCFARLVASHGKDKRKRKRV
jgi:hypothetical protein